MIFRFIDLSKETTDIIPEANGLQDKTRKLCVLDPQFFQHFGDLYNAEAVKQQAN